VARDEALDHAALARGCIAKEDKGDGRGGEDAKG